jgi:hypothetical protein
MSLTYHTLHISPQLQIQRIACRPETRARGCEEYAPASIVVFPLHGVFMKHHASGGEALVSPGCALFFNAGEPYRISHPTGCRDDCLVLETPEPALREMLSAECAEAQLPFGARGPGNRKSPLCPCRQGLPSNSSCWGRPRRAGSD